MSVRMTHRDFFGDVERLLEFDRQNAKSSRASATRIRALTYAQIAKALGNPKRKNTHLGKVRAQAVRSAEFRALPSIILTAGPQTLSKAQVREMAKAIVRLKSR